MAKYYSLLTDIVKLADEAGEAVMAVYNTDFKAETKTDKSLVTEADVIAEKIILSGLSELTPDIPIIAEESVADGRVPSLKGPYYWLVDPLDGTREFVDRNDEFTVNIALIRNKVPILGVVFAPALKSSYWGAPGHGAFCRTNDVIEPISVISPKKDEITIISSRHHGNNPELRKFAESLNVTKTLHAGSSLKFCIVAKGEACVYPRFGPTSEWDTAAGHAILEAAGGQVTTSDGDAFLYRKRNFKNSSFIAWGGIKPT